MAIITFQNGKQVEVALPATVYDAAKEAELASREVLAAKIGGEVVALTTPLSGDTDVTLLTFADSEGERVFNHTASHILAQAVKRLYPEVKLTIGPAIEHGFYYDFDTDIAFTPDVLKKIEDEMKKIVKENLRLERFVLPREEALARMADEPYKQELIRDLPEDAEPQATIALGDAGNLSQRIRTAVAASKHKPARLRLEITEMSAVERFTSNDAQTLAVRLLDGVCDALSE